MKQILVILALTLMVTTATTQEDIHQEDEADTHDGQECGEVRSGQKNDKKWKNTQAGQRHNQVYEEGELVDCEGRKMKEHAIHAQESELWN
jgi:hypothetical protein